MSLLFAHISLKLTHLLNLILLFRKIKKPIVSFKKWRNSISHKIHYKNKTLPQIQKNSIKLLRFKKIYWIIPEKRRIIDPINMKRVKRLPKLVIEFKSQSQWLLKLQWNQNKTQSANYIRIMSCFISVLNVVKWYVLNVYWEESIENTKTKLSHRFCSMISRSSLTTHPKSYSFKWIKSKLTRIKNTHNWTKKLRKSQTSDKMRFNILWKWGEISKRNKRK